MTAREKAETDVAELAVDLGAERESLVGIVGRLTAEEWRRATPAAGWTVVDQVAHLSYFDGAAAMALAEPDAFRRVATELLDAWDRIDELTLGRDQAPDEILEGWHTNGERLAGAIRNLADGDRIPWYGPSMSPKSFLTARIMEHWAHGQDVADALGITRSATSRLRHIAHLGYITRGWSYANRGLEIPSADVGVALAGPDGAEWSFGPATATEAISGPAVDFCLVVTQRRHVDDTELEVTGAAARDWMLKAQAFAGAPTDGPSSRPEGRA